MCADRTFATHATPVQSQKQNEVLFRSDEEKSVRSEPAVDSLHGDHQGGGGGEKKIKLTERASWEPKGWRQSGRWGLRDNHPLG